MDKDGVLASPPFRGEKLLQATRASNLSTMGDYSSVSRLANGELLFLQGMPEPEERSENPLMNWRHLLLRRLTGGFASIVSGTTTSDSESKLDMPRSVYYGIGRCSPDFGWTLISFERPQGAAMSLLRSTPFDTGGLAQDHIPVKATATLQRKRDILAAHTYEGLDYSPVAAAWIQDNYFSELEYARGERPKALLVEEIDFTAEVEDRAWTWEARLPAIDFESTPLVPRTIYFKIGDRLSYLDWVHDQGLLSEADSEAHEDFVNEISVEVEQPHREMIQDLEKEMAA